MGILLFSIHYPMTQMTGTVSSQMSVDYLKEFIKQVTALVNANLGELTIICHLYLLQGSSMYKENVLGMYASKHCLKLNVHSSIGLSEIFIMCWFPSWVVSHLNLDIHGFRLLKIFFFQCNYCAMG